MQRLIEAIAALPEPTRTIFFLRRIEQLPQRGIAERLSMPESTVEKHISRALMHMSNLFGRGGKHRIVASKEMVKDKQTGNGTGDST